MSSARPVPRGLLGDLLGQVDLGELLDPLVMQRVESELQRLAPERQASGAEGVADLLRELGPLSAAEIALRLAGEDGEAAVATLEAARRIIRVPIGGEECWASVEDAARLRDALGVALPAGIPDIFLEPAADPLRDLIARYARTHTPFTTGEAAARFGLGVAVVDDVLERLREQGKLLKGNFGVERRLEAQDVAAAGANPLSRHEWVGDEVFRRLRLRSLQAAREATRPVSREAYVRLVLERQGLVAESAGHAALHRASPAGGALEGKDGVARVVEQLAGLPLPASLWDAQIFRARVRDYTSGMLDELLATGVVLWSGHGRLGDEDGLVALHLHEFAAETLPAEPGIEAQADLSPLQQSILDVLADGGAYFVRQLAALAQARLRGGEGGSSLGGMFREVAPSDLHDALWGLAWAGYVTTDTWSPLRALSGSHAAQRPRPVPVSRRRRGLRGFASAERLPAVSASTLSDPTMAGRWSLLHREPVSDTARALALVEGLLDRYGVVTRGAAIAEDVPGGFPALLPVFRGMEDAGRVLRGRFVEGLGGAQFAERATIDRLRELADRPPAEPVAAALSAGDPANPFGTTIPWPPHQSKSRPTRRSGAFVVIVDGRLMLYLAQGGRNLLTYADADDPATAKPLATGLMALSAALKREKGLIFTLETVDDHPAGTTNLASALRAVGFSRVPKGLSWYG